MTPGQSPVITIGCTRCGTAKHTVKLQHHDLGRSFQYNETPHNVIVTTGTWGYCDNYADTGLTPGCQREYNHGDQDHRQRRGV